MPTKEEKIAKQRRSNATARVRTLMIAGRTADAEAYAAEQGFDVFDARLGPEYQNAAEPMFAALEAARNAPVALPDAAPVMDIGDESVEAESMVAAAPESINGWPVLTDAVVWGFPPNRGMVVIELPDRRRASMWRARNATYRIFMKLRARIVKTEGDPIYEEVMPPRAAF
jgi:hypothetical protein